MSTSLEILCVKGENSQFDQLAKLIEAENFKVKSLEDINSVIPTIAKRKPALILMDLLLQGKDAIDVLKELESKGLKRHSSVVILSDRKENYVEITALNSGADDFLVKPVNKRVFVSRLHAWLRQHSATKLSAHLTKAEEEVILDQERFTLLVKGNEVLLQRKEFEIVSLLASRPKRVFSREEIKEMVWGDPSHLVRNRTIDVHIRNLRMKIGHGYIKTYKGIGYSFDRPLAH
jgi:two-component system alkaline phosphatase synthesis response regulator PhoP